jgi:hypothetical protein
MRVADLHTGKQFSGNCLCMTRKSPTTRNLPSFTGEDYEKAVAGTAIGRQATVILAAPLNQKLLKDKSPE